jgi:protein involved in polysaccharide export with SLBB domain
MGMFPGLNMPSVMPGFPSPSDALQGSQDANVFFETVNDSVYILGTGDVLALGLGTRIATIPVNPEGYVVIDGIGTVRVGDTSLRKAKKILMDKVLTVYKGERIFVTLAKAKKVQASIVGAVSLPGIYTVSAAAHLTDLLFLAQGFSNNASKLVTVIGKGGDTTTYDLDRYYLDNEMSQNPYIETGDQVKIEEVDFGKPTVLLRENELVNTVQLKDGQSAYDAVNAYNSIKKRKSWDQIVVYEGDAPVATLGTKESKAYFPKPGQILEVKSYKPTVFVGGAVLHPSYFEFNANYNALDYIASAGIISTTGNIQKIRIIGSNGKERVGDSGLVAPGDHIIVPESKESRVRDYIGLLASIASIVTSITLTVITLKQ